MREALVLIDELKIFLSQRQPLKHVSLLFLDHLFIDLTVSAKNFDYRTCYLFNYLSYLN